MAPVHLQFTSDRFDFQSDLPEEANAGNRFYGKDLAEHLVAALGSARLAGVTLEEDWGWMVASARGASPLFSIAIYNLNDHGEGGRPGAPRWGLTIEEQAEQKKLGLFTTRVAVPVSAALRTAVEQAIAAAGGTPAPWDGAV